MFCNVITFDIEEYFQVANFTSVVSERDWDKFEKRAVFGTDIILEILDEFSVKATFFVLGWVAERSEEIVVKIFERGHEIGTHGYAHKLVYEQSAHEFEKDLKKSLKLIEAITGVRPKSYRAPSFSVTKKSLWAFDVLLENGIKYDTSVFPIMHDRYGIIDFNPEPHIVLKKGDGSLKEFPITPYALRLFGKNFNLPFSGGGYFRLLPFGVVSLLTADMNRKGRPVIFYMHPWEFDPGQPKIDVGSKITYFRHYAGITKNEGKLRKLLSSFKFVSLEKWFEEN